MKNNNKTIIILTSIFTLLPVLTGSIVPLILFAVHLLCVFLTMKDPRNKEQNPKAMRIVYWIIPFLSFYTTAINYAVKSGLEFSMDIITMILIGFMFVVIGNYLPKCKQNYTLGIKVPWVYTSEDNWNNTHRFGGKIWVIGGLLLMLSVLFPEGIAAFVMLVGIFAMVLIPVIYSYLFYRKEKAEGKATSPSVLLGRNGKLSAVFLVVILIFVGIIMFTGDIRFSVQEDVLTIKADYWDDMNVSYDKVESIEYREEGVSGRRVYGYGSARLLMGTFDNDEFGYYTRYSYTMSDSAVVMVLSTGELVISDKDTETTKALYDKLAEKVN